ncbi:phosphate/phosphite/phosphonate ABC transporter substrate-binding protein [Streptomyces johnsoniae]|uniref:Phosphate/phosphite/phosphonate ABC transporter substrate-binding protein n=1 Tax=Streptomyces johnsoniae TaxID=3075532 RepID=A0ABU2SC90_9ACTN|nr:phosphate/phosphite/phosphonate ABC transporter substrate-binding protein [Streptomyces sp. DSM 41886]MDT0446597.1 phosphate/phosphite/phosphonate ABC transporter substrate-binding protein [Streptomyces sp. DSM 41886]
MPSTPRLPRAAVLALLPLVLAACGSSAAEDSSADGRDPDTLVLAAIPSEESTALAQRYEPIIQMLEEETGKNVELQQATNYAAVIEAQRAGKADIAFYGPLSYIVAKDSGVGLEIVAAPVAEQGDEPGYRSVGVSRAGSGIDSMDDLAGGEVCFVDENSTSGYLYPAAGLIAAGLGEGDYARITAGGHDASVLSVADGQCDAGFATEDMATRQLVESGQIGADDLTVFWESAMIPGSPVAISDDLTDELRQTLTDALQNKTNADHLEAQGYCAGGEDCLIEGNWGYVPVSDADYASVRDVCATTRNEQCEAGS